VGAAKRRIILLIAAGGLLLLAPTPASGATVIGQTFAGGAPCGTDLTVTQFADTSAELTYEVPQPGGVITSWSYFAAGGADEVKFLHLRPAGEGAFNVVFANTQNMMPGRINTFPIRTRAQAGDVIGLHVGPAGTTCVLRVPDSGNLIGGCSICDPPLGTTFSSNYLEPGALLNVAAVVEADCDSDGSGDESQDANIASCPPGPQVTFTKVPKRKVKTTKKRVSEIFRFDSDEQGSTFDCVLDGKQELKPCTSPLMVKVNKGRHRLSVTATDPGGFSGAAATHTWKVKRKKEKEK
jgi:hypothetical protein